VVRGALQRWRAAQAFISKMSSIFDMFMAFQGVKITLLVALNGLKRL
jgi:hypothetical protein